MDIDALLDILLAMGFPGVITVTIVLAVRAYAPKMIEAFKTSKAAEQQAFVEGLKEYQAQAEKITEVATASRIAIEQATNALRQNSDANQAMQLNLTAVEKALGTLNDSFVNHDRRAEAINVEVQKLIEGSRREARL